MPESAFDALRARVHAAAMKNRDRGKKSTADGGDPTVPVTPPAGMAWRLNTESFWAWPDRLGLLELWHADDLRRATRKWRPVHGLKPVAHEVAHSAKYLRSTSVVVLQKWHDMQRQQAIARIERATAELGIRAANTRHDTDVDNHDPRTAP